jgi:hypothetical protein
MIWILLLFNGGALIQLDTGSHPPLPLTHNNSPTWYFFIFFGVLNFQGHFEALNSVCFAINLLGPRVSKVALRKNLFILLD